MALRYRPYATDRFRDSISELDKATRTKVDEAVLKELCVDPGSCSKLLSHELKGKRSYRVDDYRIVFATCDECRDNHFERFNGCKDCRQHGRSDLILFDIGHRGKIYDELQRLHRLRLK